MAQMRPATSLKRLSRLYGAQRLLGGSGRSFVSFGVIWCKWSFGFIAWEKKNACIIVQDPGGVSLTS